MTRKQQIWGGVGFLGLIAILIGIGFIPVASKGPPIVVSGGSINIRTLDPVDWQCTGNICTTDKPVDSSLIRTEGTLPNLASTTTQSDWVIRITTTPYHLESGTPHTGTITIKRQPDGSVQIESSASFIPALPQQYRAHGESYFDANCNKNNGWCDFHIDQVTIKGLNPNPSPQPLTCDGGTCKIDIGPEQESLFKHLF